MWLQSRRRLALAGGGLVALAAVAVAAYAVIESRSKGAPEGTPAPGPKLVIHEQQPEAVRDLGFPAFATKNTTRVSGVDPVADAAAVALAVFPSTGDAPRPDAVTLVEAGDWAAGIAAASLMAPPIRAPVLITASESTPQLTSDALRALAPQGSAAADGHQAFAIGSAATPAGLRTERVGGGDAAELAAAIARLRQTLSGQAPEHVLLASSDRPEFSMPAAAWAARSGDPILFVHRNSAPAATLSALRRERGVPVYALGPPSAISDKALAQVDKVTAGVNRIGAEDPVENAIAFARYVNGTFGWNINDPGHGFVIASEARPLDAAASAALSASGDWGPLLLTDDAERVPGALRGYLLDLKPGYATDPTRAVYNHIWLIGDPDAISVGFQAQVDELAEVAQVRSGTGAAPGGPPAAHEHEQAPGPKR